MRLVFVLAALLITACSATTGDGRRTANIDKSYKARDACFARMHLPAMSAITDHDISPALLPSLVREKPSNWSRQPTAMATPKWRRRSERIPSSGPRDMS